MNSPSPPRKRALASVYWIALASAGKYPALIHRCSCFSRGPVRRSVDGSPGLLEDPVVDRLGGTVGRHELLKREREAAAAGRGVPDHDGQHALGLRRGEQRFELGHRRRRLGHPDLGGQLLVVEDTGEAVVEAHRVERPGAPGAVGGDPVLSKLRRRPFVPAEPGRIPVQVLQQPVLDEGHHRRQPDQVRRAVP